MATERVRLATAGREDLANRVRWIADEEGDGAGFDILSFNTSGGERLVEVKTTNGPARTPFFLSRNENDIANQRAESGHFIAFMTLSDLREYSLFSHR